MAKNQQKPKKEFAPMTIVPRSQWGALPHKGVLEPLVPPFQAVILTHTRTKECYNDEQCMKFVRELQIRNMEEEGMPDVQFNPQSLRTILISYLQSKQPTTSTNNITVLDLIRPTTLEMMVCSWMVGCKGHVYEGRGWHSAPTLTDPRHIKFTAHINASTVMVAYIGTFLDRFPSDEMFNTSSQILLEPLKFNMYTDDFKIVPHLITKKEKKPKPQAIEKKEEPKTPVAGAAHAATLKKHLKKYVAVEDKHKLLYNVRAREDEQENQQDV